MRKGTKKQLMELMATISEALHYIKVTKNKDENDMLGNCSLCMKTVCKTINQIDDPDSVICDNANDFVQLLAQTQARLENTKEFKRSLFDLRRKLAFIRSEVDKIEPRIEVVFLPYKASMWDSMESIWLAAAADRNCDAYVIPVPYYDMNADRIVSRLNYEGELFPEEVPVVSYQKYDLAARRPDVIYFHNPYDGYNRVTSVAPEYYSDKLKQYTNMLVYVPYDLATIRVSDHMCQTSGVNYADKIIVQSELVKKVYAKYVSAEKVLALGSPKIDKIVWAQKHIPAMPDEWKKIAGNRKLILYNTHLTPLMVSGEIVCAKLRYVFSCFEGRNDVCLLWRPHPLSKATIESMNPRPLKEYMRLVEEYKCSGFGIYDDTADVHRAIALSSAYYGDESSLVPMCGSAGKPIMIQDVYDQEKTASFITYLIDGDVMWFAAFFFNGLFKMDMKTKQISFVGKFPGEQNQNWMYSKIMKFGNRLFFFPAMAESIVEFDINTSSVKMHAIKLLTNRIAQISGFFSAILWKKWVYMLPLVGHVIVKFNIETGEMRYEEDWYEKLRPFVKDDQATLFSSVVQREKYIWCPCWQDNLIFRFDLESLEFTTYRVGLRNNTYYNIAEGGGDFWFVTLDGDAVVRWNPDTQKTRQYKIPEWVSKEKIGLFWPIFYKGTVWIFPAAGDKILKLNVQSGEFSEFTQYPEGFRYLYKPTSIIKYGAFEVQDSIITAFPIKGNMMLQIDMETDRALGTELNWPEYNPAYFNQYLNVDSTNRDRQMPILIDQEHNSFSSLEGFLNFVAGYSKSESEQRAAEFLKSIENSDGSCGAKVHEKIRELLNPNNGGYDI